MNQTQRNEARERATLRIERAAGKVEEAEQDLLEAVRLGDSTAVATIRKCAELGKFLRVIAEARKQTIAVLVAFAFSGCAGAKWTVSGCDEAGRCVHVSREEGPDTPQKWDAKEGFNFGGFGR